LKPMVKYSLLISAVSVPLLSFYALINDTVYEMSNLDERSNIIKIRYPEEVADYLNDYHPGGNILNKLGVGGFLISRLSPKYKVYIDGRTNILYPIEHLEHAVALWGNDDLLAEEIKNREVQYAIFKKSNSKVLFFEGIDKFSLVFTDGRYMLFSDNNINAFSVTSKLMIFPMCWSDSLAPKVIEEKLLSDKLFSNKSYAIKDFLNVISGYIIEDERMNYIESLKFEDISADVTRRLIAYLSVINQNYEIAKKYFVGISNKDDFDLLMLAYTMSMLGDTEDAESILYYFNYINESKLKGQALTIDKAVIFAATLKNIENKGELKNFPASYSVMLEKIIKKSGYDLLNQDSVFPYQDFCK